MPQVDRRGKLQVRRDRRPARPYHYSCWLDRSHLLGVGVDKCFRRSSRARGIVPAFYSVCSVLRSCTTHAEFARLLPLGCPLRKLSVDAMPGLASLGRSTSATGQALQRHAATCAVCLPPSLCKGAQRTAVIQPVTLLPAPTYLL